MRRPPSTLQSVRLALGFFAAVAFMVRGASDPSHGRWVLILVGVVVLVALALRLTIYRD